MINFEFRPIAIRVVLPPTYYVLVPTYKYKFLIKFKFTGGRGKGGGGEREIPRNRSLRNSLKLANWACKYS